MKIDEQRKDKVNSEKTLQDRIVSIKAKYSEISSQKDSEINNLKKTLSGIEAEAVINQEEIRKELMETRNELSILKESLKHKKATKKKKTSAKPARA